MILSYIKNNRDYKNMSYKEAKEYALLYSMDQFTLTAFKIEEYPIHRNIHRNSLAEPFLCVSAAQPGHRFQVGGRCR